MSNKALTVADLINMLRSLSPDTELQIVNVGSPYAAEWSEQIPLRISEDGKRLYFLDWGDFEARLKVLDSRNLSLWIQSKEIDR